MTTKPSDNTWMKNHPLEGDNIITGIYNFLAKKNPKTMKPCLDIFVPDTIVFEHNFPRGWYTTDIKAREVMRKQGKELDASTIEEGFVSAVKDSCPVVATYICTAEEDTGSGTEQKTLVEVFNKDTIGEFLSRKTKREGILQKFIMPKGYNNSVIKAVWSPRICMVQRRTNKYSIDDRKRAENDPFSITVTYEGPTHLSDECTVSGNVAVQVKKLCSYIVQHFYYTEHKFITRMVLYFKADKQDKLWFLWCGSLRAADRNANSEMPVNLVTNFAEPSGASAFDEDKILWEADEAFLRVTKDEMFFETYMKNVPLQFKGATGDDDAEKADNVDFHTESQGDGSGAGAAANAKGNFDWTSAPTLVQETYERLTLERENVGMLFEDMFYKAKSHFTTNRKEPFNLDVPRRAVQAVTQNGVVDIMRTLSLMPKGTAPDGGMRYTIEPNNKTPVTKMLDVTKDWLDNYYRTRINRLQEASKMYANNTSALEAAIGEL